MDFGTHDQDEFSVSFPGTETLDPDAAAVTGSGRGHSSTEASRPAYRMHSIPAHEAALLQEHYATLGAQWCAEQLGLSLRQIQRRTTTLGLRKTKTWTPESDDMLRFQWGTKSPEQIAKQMGRTPGAVYERAGENRKRWTVPTDVWALTRYGSSHARRIVETHDRVGLHNARIPPRHCWLVGWQRVGGRRVVFESGEEGLV